MALWKPATAKPKQKAPLPPVSVVVAAHNECDNLKALLPLLLAQDYPDFEVIVVDDRSWDDTFAYLYELRKTAPRLRVAYVGHTPDGFTGKKYALTIGIKAAKHDLLLFTDADCRPASTQWIAQMAARFHDSAQIVLGYSPYEEAKGLLNAFIRYETFITALQYISLALWGWPYMGVGRNLAYRKSLFLQQKGFHKHMNVVGGDDDLFVNQVAKGRNTAVCIDAESIVFSLPKVRWGDWYKQKKRHLSVGKHYRWPDKLLLGLFQSSHLGLWAVALPLLLWPLAEPALLWLLAVVLACLLGRWLLMWLVWWGCLRQLGGKVPLVALPLLDVLYSIYYFWVGLAALRSKTVLWK